MKNEVYNATNSGTFANISTVAKNALLAPSNQDNIAKAKNEIHALVTAGQIAVRDNLHLYLGLPNPAAPISNGLAAKTVVHDFDSLNIYAIKLA